MSRVLVTMLTALAGAAFIGAGALVLAAALVPAVPLLAIGLALVAAGVLLFVLALAGILAGRPSHPPDGRAW